MTDVPLEKRTRVERLELERDALVGAILVLAGELERARGSSVTQEGIGHEDRDEEIVVARVALTSEFWSACDQKGIRDAFRLHGGEDVIEIVGECDFHDYVSGLFHYIHIRGPRRAVHGGDVIGVFERDEDDEETYLVDIRPIPARSDCGCLFGEIGSEEV